MFATGCSEHIWTTCSVRGIHTHAAQAERCCCWPNQAVGKALREREAALLTVAALEAELGRKRRGIGSLEEAGSQVRGPALPLVLTG